MKCIRLPSIYFHLTPQMYVYTNIYDVAAESWDGSSLHKITREKGSPCILKGPSTSVDKKRSTCLTSPTRVPSFLNEDAVDLAGGPGGLHEWHPADAALKVHQVADHDAPALGARRVAPSAVAVAGLRTGAAGARICWQCSSPLIGR
ncbi:uncharacterized protein LOC142579659 [Dermacentor variabilis]|uniref:uncharacterized protein LOC142579659 n=1 Tax=Dermacentor variabilis TaxID=34621 RepID=UPI003F5C3DAD